jgi:hypothetical protein
MRFFVAAAAAAIKLAAVVATAQQSPGGLFPSPFLVEHQVIVTDPDGGGFTSEPVVDHYGGSMIVSVRPDGSRLIVDFARRELTEIRPSSGTYTVISFDRMAQLTRDVQRLEGPPVETKRGGEEPVELRVSEAAPGAGFAIASAAAVAMATADRPGAAGLRRIEVARMDGDGKAEPLVELWLDERVRLGAPALDAIEDFELGVLGATADEGSLAPLRAAAQARRFAGGALALLSARQRPGGGGRVEDVALRVERLDAFPPDLVTVPEGLERTAHPLEIILAHAEQEEELRRLMGGEAER